MRKLLSFSIISLLLLAASMYSQNNRPTGEQSSKMAKTEQDILNLVSELANAIVKKDTAAMERLLADDYIDISSTGTVATKSQLVPVYKNPALVKLESIETIDSKVRVYGAVAVMTARIVWRGQTADGQVVNRVYANTVVAVKKNGRWQIASTHASVVAPPK